MRVQELYPDAEAKYEDWVSGCFSDYQPIIDDLGKVLIQVDERDYQGSSWVLYQNTQDSALYGILEFGWGSCSGCDALQACNSYEDAQALYDSLKESTHWGSREEIIAYITEHDWVGSWGDQDDKKRFVQESLVILKEGATQ